MTKWPKLPLSLLAPLAALALVAGCADRDPAAPLAVERLAPADARGLPNPGARGIVVMTRNLYLGADIDPLLDPTLTNFQRLQVATNAWLNVLATNFPERAGALAEEIATHDPHLVGLQEVVTYYTQFPGDAAFGGATQATTVTIDFLELLLDSLAVRGVEYRAVASVTLTDIELPICLNLAGCQAGNPNAFMDIRFVDHDVILARSDVNIGDTGGQVYATLVPVSIGGFNTFIYRGFTWADATVNGYSFRFINTHLEIQRFEPIQEAQTAELLAFAEASPLPVIMVGDFNSAADLSQTDTYSMITAAGYFDVWSRVHPRDPGYTCCHDDDLLNPLPELTQRIDLIFVEQDFERSFGRLVGGAHATIVGDEPGDRTQSGLWPSDHAGVVAILRFPPGLAGANPGHGGTPPGQAGRSTAKSKK